MRAAGVEDQRRAEAVITALLHCEDPLALALIAQDDRPHALALAACVMFARFFRSEMCQRGVAPEEAWQVWCRAGAKRDSGLT